MTQDNWRCYHVNLSHHVSSGRLLNCNVHQVSLSPPTTMHFGLPSTLYALLATFLWPPEQPPTKNSLSFHLRHIHATTPSDQVLFADVRDPQGIHAQGQESYDLRIPSTRSLKIPRTSASSFQAARRRSRVYGESTIMDWSEDLVEGPDVGDKEVLLTLAKMTANAYLQVGEKGWYDLEGRWNQVSHYCYLRITITHLSLSHSHSVGTPKMMALGDMFSFLKITQQLSFQSKALPPLG